MRIRHYSITKRLVFVGPFLYVLVLATASLTGRGEIYPFFAWDLFAGVPAGWVIQTPAVVAHPMDDSRNLGGGGGRWVIPSPDPRHLKVLREVLHACERRAAPACRSAVARLLLPLVVDGVGSGAVEFSLVWAAVDLRALREDIWALAAGRTQRMDYARVATVLSRWRAAAAGGLHRVDGGTP